MARKTTTRKKTTRPAARRRPKARAKTPAYPAKPNGVREITAHQVNGLNEKIRVLVLDDPGPGGANHDYRIKVDARLGAVEIPLLFQKGPVQEAGVNGLSNEALLVIVRDRLEGFQSGPHAGPENAKALCHLETALTCLHDRTRDRVARGVEGTTAK